MTTGPKSVRLRKGWRAEPLRWEHSWCVRGEAGGQCGYLGVMERGLVGGVAERPQGPVTGAPAGHLRTWLYCERDKKDTGDL